GVLPFALVDLVLLWPLTQYDSLVMASLNVGDVGVYHIRYLWILTSAILIQSPLALCGVTYFIGQAVFIERPTVRQVFSAVWGRASAILLVIGIWRLSLISLVPLVLLFRDPIFRPEIEVPLYLLCFTGLVQLIRGFRPFAPEILLLERCPIFKSKDRPEQLSYMKRSSWLHSGLALELFSVHLGVAMVEALTALSLSMGFLFLIGVLTGIWRWGPWMDFVLYPTVVWMVATWGTVIRFLLYMNSRIRTEGWEIELRLKAESQRLEGLPS
ncbi:MAG: hypothetical protein ABL921_16715, partial [Pirellula sp.]